LAYHQNDCEPLLRVAPVVICHYHHPDLCLHQIEQLTQTTHVSTECVDACRYFASLLIGVLMGVEKQQLLSATFNLMDVSTYGPLRYNRFSQSYLQHCSETQIRKDPSQEAIICQSAKTQHFLRSLYPSVLKVQKGSFLHKSRNEILSDDSLIHCLEAALWAFSNGDTFEEGCINAINLGGNSTGIGAIYGQLAGAYYGYQQIPNRWISKIQHMEILQDFLIPITKIANENLR
jgi:ADP-ribosylglycohydrolase